MKKIALLILFFVPVLTLAQATVPQGGTGLTSVPAYGLLVGDSALRLKATTSPTVGIITATSSTATSTLPKLNVTTAITILGEYITNFTNYVRSLFSASSPLTYSAGAFGCQTASGSQAGCISSTDWTTFNGKGSGTVTSVGLSVPAFLSVANSPVTTSNTLAVTFSGTAIPIANGGTNSTSLTTNTILYFNGTSIVATSSNPLYVSALTATSTSVTSLFNLGSFATTLTVPAGTAPVISTTGGIAYDSTDKQLLIGTTTANTPGVIPLIQRLYSATIASSSVDFISGGRIPLPIEREGYIISEIDCQTEAGTSVVINIDTSAGGANTDTVTCDSDGQSDTAMSANYNISASALMDLEIGTVTGSVDYVTFSVWGYYTRQ